MFFNKKEEPKRATERAVQTKTNNELVQEIHANFYTEVDRLLAEAKISHSLETDKQDLIDKCKRLRKLGFTNSKEVVEAEEELSRLQSLERENKEKEGLVEVINYFSVKYPQYKFITEDSVKKICQKYNLVYGEVSRYEGTIPDENLKHIEDFKIKEEDKCYICNVRRYSSFGPSELTIGYGSEKDIEEMVKKFKATSHVSAISSKCSLEIAAPKKDFNMRGMEVKDSKLQNIPPPPDPVVLQPVVYKSQKYYLIVTAWGEEATDELVVNQKLN